MMEAEQFLAALGDTGFEYCTGTPCSYLKPLINGAILSERFRFLDAVNEGDAIALAAGLTLAGKKCLVMFQNSGLGNAINPLTSLACTFEVPLLMVISLRGEPGGKRDEPQHKLMGEITTDLLETMRIGWRYFPEQAEELAPALADAANHMQEKKTPFALVMRSGSVAALELPVRDTAGRRSPKGTVREDLSRAGAARPLRSELIELVQAAAGPRDVIVGTTGYTSRELYGLADRENQFYMVGSMGCAISLGLGVSIGCANSRVIVLDGDGALLMRAGSMAMAGEFGGANLVHIVLDNQAHESTGGQRTLSGGVSFAGAASAFGYAAAYATDDLGQLREILSDMRHSGPLMIHVGIRQGVSADLPRPSQSPAWFKQRFAAHLAKISGTLSHG